jgi:site-specific recombinase
MKLKLILLSLPMLVSSCVVVPTVDHAYFNRCEISSDRKTLKVIDAAKGTNSYYSISGLILYPISGIVSGIYVAVNNVYHYGEEKIVCRSETT